MYLANVIFPAPVYPYIMSVFAWPLALTAMALEFFAIWLMDKQNRGFWVTLKNVLLANIVSTLFGICLLFIPGIPSGFLPGDQHWVRGQYWWQIAGVSFVSCFLLSIIVEGAFYRWSRIATSPVKPWRASIVGNIVSYGFLAIFFGPAIWKYAFPKS